MKIKWAEAPEWVRQTITEFASQHGEKRVREIRVEYTNSARIPNNYCDWNVRHIRLKMGDKFFDLHDGGYENSASDPFHVFQGGGRGELPVDGAILIYETSPKRATLYLRRLEILQ